IIENPINLINPFTYLMALANTLAIPLFWQFTVFSVVGAGLTIGSAWLVQAIRPRKSVIRWYWQWRPSLLITVPIFLFCWFNGLYATAGLVNTGLRIVAGYVEPSMFLIGANLLRVYIALLPLPVLHLIWDNRFRHTWAKLLISLVAIPVFLLIISVFEYWRMGVMCDAGLVEDSTCSFYFYPSNPLPDPASNDLKAADSLGVTLPSPTPTIQPTSTPNMER